MFLYVHYIIIYRDWETTTLTDVIAAGAPAALKSLAGLAVAAIASAATAKLLKTGASQKSYEEVLKEFTSK